MENIPQWIGVLTPMGTLMLAVVLIMRGKLIPDSMHERIITPEREARQAAERRAERAEVQVDKLTGTLDTHTHLLESIRDLGSAP